MVVAPPSASGEHNSPSFGGLEQSQRNFSLKWFDNLALSRKLLAAFAAMLLVLSALSVFAGLRLRLVANETNLITEEVMPAVVALVDMNTPAMRFQVATLRIVATDSEEQATRLLGEADAVQASIQSSQSRDAAAFLREEP